MRGGYEYRYGGFNSEYEYGYGFNSDNTRLSHACGRINMSMGMADLTVTKMA